MSVRRLVLALFLCSCNTVLGDEYAKERMVMVRTIEEQVRLTYPWTAQKTLDPRVLEAVSTVPRHQFVPEKYRVVLQVE